MQNQSSYAALVFLFYISCKNTFDLVVIDGPATFIYRQSQIFKQQIPRIAHLAFIRRPTWAIVAD
jgi:hypothetical protein